MELRKKWGLDKNLLKYDKSKSTFGFPWKTSKEQSKKHLKAIKPYEKILEKPAFVDVLVRESKIEQFLKGYEEALRLLPAEDFRLDIQTLRKKYKRPVFFDEIIAKAVLYGKVGKKDYVTAEIMITDPETEYIDYFQESELIIKIYPSARAEDIRKLLVKELESKKKEYVRNILKGELKQINPRWQLETYRKWYWLNRYQKLSYEKLLNMENDNFSESTIGLGIARYRKLLTSK
jgi:hypothetical protein